MINPKLFLRSLAIKEKDFVVSKNSNLFIGGITGRTGKSFLLGILERILGNEYVVINEHGSFALSQLRHAGYEFYQVGSGNNTKKEAYLDYFYRFATNEAYNRWKIYGQGLKGFRTIVPKRAIKIAFHNLRKDLLNAQSLMECNLGLGKFYSRLLNYHSFLKEGSLRWISEETGYGRHIKDLYDLIPDCRVVIMVRDGRNSIVSMAEKGWNDGDVFQLIHRWKDFTQITLDSIEHVPTENYLLVKFENLLLKFNESVEKILAFYRIDLSNEIEKNIEKEGIRFAHLKNDLLEWKEGLNEREIKYFDKTCQCLMKRLGYDE